MYGKRIKPLPKSLPAGGEGLESARSPFLRLRGKGQGWGLSKHALSSAEKRGTAAGRIDGSGPADICIEIISPESVERDYGQKFTEYEKAGVHEYWIVDPIRQRCDFNRLGESGVYAVIAPDSTGHYQTPLLPRLVLHVPTLWLDQLPGGVSIAQAVQAMFSDPA